MIEDDYIKREAALEAIDRIRLEVWLIDIPSPTVPEYIEHHEGIQHVLEEIDALRKKMEQLPGIDEQKPAEHPELSEWCTDCKEYDREKHCCPRYNRVIREALTEMKAQKTGKWIKHPKSLWPVAKCSECKAICVYADTAKYCPVCGARMEGGTDDEG